MGSLISRGLVMAFGYAYPAYECFKTVEKNKPEIEQLRFWCQYWILVAVLTVCERIGDSFVSWVPMYSEAKLAFYIYLWFPKTRGAAYVYDAFFKPYVAKHETDIDHNLLELKTRTGNIASLYWQKVSGYGQKRIYEILEYIASQSVPNTHRRQTQQPGARCRQNSVPQDCQPVVTTQPLMEPRSPSLSAACEDEDGLGKGVGRSKAPPGNSAGPASNTLETTEPEPLPAVVLNTKKTSATPPNAEIVRECMETDMDPMQIEPASSRNEIVNPSLRESVMHEAIQVTRGLWSKT